MKIQLVIFFLSLSSFLYSQNLGLSIGFANFDDTDGYNLDVNYRHSLNNYFSIEPNICYAKTSNFPKIHEPLNSESNWLSKSSIFSVGLNGHIDFINTQKNNFSFFAGLGFANINAVESENNIYITDILIEEQNAFTKTFGIQYLYKFKKFHIGIKAKIFDTFTNNEDYFGQESYRALNFVVLIPLNN